MTTAIATTFSDRAMAAVQRGLSIIPCRPRSKNPLAKHGAKSRVNTEEGVRQFAADVPEDCNYGICSDERFTILETDDRANLTKLLGRPVPTTLCVSARANRGYWVFAQTPKTLAVNGSPKYAGTWEWRHQNQYCVGFGSIHPDTGFEYKLVTDVEPAPMPDWLVDKLLELHEGLKTKNRVPAAVPSEDEKGRFTYENVEEMLAALQERNLEFEYEDGKPTAGRGWNVRCWNDAQHTDPGMPINSSSVVWVNERGFAMAHCSHNHCGYGWKEFVANWNIADLQEKITKPWSVTLGGRMPIAAEEGEKPAPPKPREIIARPFTDLGNADRFVASFGDSFRHTAAKGWLAWDGARWAPEARDTVFRAAIEAVLKIREEAGIYADDEDGKKSKLAVYKWASASQSSSKLEALLHIAQNAKDIAVKVASFDKDAWLFNCQNGTLDLRTGDLLPHSRSHLITSISPIQYTESAECPRWMDFLDRVMEGDREMIRFLARAVGYTLTGSNKEQCFFINFGNGANGKSTFMETVKYLMGEYGVTTPMRTFQDKKDPGIPNDLAALRSARLVLASEAERTNRLAESLIKSLTGGEAIAARFLHQEYFEFTPQFKIWLGTNHRPQVVGTDDGIWRRVNLIRWGVTIPKEERDPNLGEDLKREAPGILNWALAGLADYRANGLGVPEKVREATTEYREQEDSLGRFVSDECTVDGATEEGAEQLYATYTQWCQNGKERPLMQKLFKVEMERRGYPYRRKNKGRVYCGLKLTSGRAF